MNVKNKTRIENLREQALLPCISFDGVYADFLIRYEENADLGAIEDRYADAYTYALSKLQPSIDQDELLVGKPVHPVTEPQKADWERLYSLRDSFSVPGQDSHMAIDYELLLRAGTSGIAQTITQYERETQDKEKLVFYRAAKECLRAVEVCAENHAKEAERLAGLETDEYRKNELLEIARICKRVPKYPAESFHEALQSVHFITYILSFQPFLYRTHQYQLGHPDRYLLPYYERDIASGKITVEEAQVLIDCLAIQINRRVPNGLSSGYMLGGRDKNGIAVQNELTALFMQAIDDIRLVYPAVGLCVCKDTDEKYLRQACEILSHGRSHPAIFNDEIITEGLRLYGVSESESHEYIHSTCVEITPVAASSVWVASPYTNMPQLLLDLLDQDFKSFDELLNTLFTRLDERVENNYLTELAGRRVRNERGFCPLLSCFVNDCLARGVDIERDGARYRWIMPSFVGVANLADSLFVLKKLVFEEKRYAMDSVLDMLRANFEGYEKERKLFLDGVEKYGNDVDEIDSLVRTITEKIIEICEKNTQKHGDKDGKNRLVPSVFCWIMHEWFGRATGATPDGRKANFPLGDGSGPCQGREKSGPLASVLSSTKWSHKEFIGGVAVNMKFAKKTVSGEALQNMLAIVKSYLERGGFEMQINVVDENTLLEARKTPELYQDLVVRIGGYSDYFVRLSPQMQEEVILRTAHALS